MRHVLEREGSILEHLAGDPGPVPLDMGSHEERPYLLMQWCPGVPVSMIAAELRETPTPDGPSGLLQLCCRVLESYATLHARGVIHGDVHPRNLLVGPDGVLKIVDYGLARLEGSSTVGEPLRGGLVYSYEPELAQAFRLGLSRVVHKYSDG